MALAAIALVAAVLVAEIVATVHYHWRDRDDYTYHFGVPWWSFRSNRCFQNNEITAGKLFYTDHSGYRVPGPERSGAITYSMCIVGASNMSGLRLCYADSISGRLEQALGSPILNLSAIGYDSDQGLWQLRRALDSGDYPALRVALISFGINDVGHWADNPALGGTALFIHRLRLLSYVATELVVKPTRRQLRQHCATYLPRVPLHRFKQNLIEMERLCAARGITPIFLMDPLVYYPVLDSAAIQDILRNYYILRPDILRTDSTAERDIRLLLNAQDFGLETLHPIIDPEKLEWKHYEAVMRLKPLFFDTNAVVQRAIRELHVSDQELFQPGYQTLGRVYPDHCHLNALGWRIVARELATFLRANGAV